MFSGAQHAVMRNTRNGESLVMRGSKFVIGRKAVDSSIQFLQTSLSGQFILHCELRTGRGVLVLIPLDSSCFVDMKAVSMNHPVILSVGSVFQTGGSEYEVIRLPRRLYRQLPSVPAIQSVASGWHSDDFPCLLEVELKFALSGVASSSLLHHVKANECVTCSESPAMPIVDDIVLEQATDFICRQVFCRPKQPVANAGLLRSVLDELELMSRSSEQLLTWLQSFLYDYEESHNQSTTAFNPWPGDEAVCILLCELVKMSENMANANSVQFWLQLLIVLGQNSIRVCLVLIIMKFQGVLAGLLCMRDVGILAGGTYCIICTLLSVIVETRLPKGCKLPLGEGYLDIIIHSLLRSVQRSAPEPLFVSSACQLFMSVVTAATTWWLDVSAAGPAVLAYLRRVAPPVLEKAAEAFADHSQILLCIKAIMTKLDIKLSERFSSIASPAPVKKQDVSGIISMEKSSTKKVLSEEPRVSLSEYPSRGKLRVSAAAQGGEINKDQKTSILPSKMGQSHYPPLSDQRTCAAAGTWPKTVKTTTLATDAPVHSENSAIVLSELLPNRPEENEMAQSSGCPIQLQPDVDDQSRRQSIETAGQLLNFQSHDEPTSVSISADGVSVLIPRASPTTHSTCSFTHASEPIPPHSCEHLFEKDNVVVDELLSCQSYQTPILNKLQERVQSLRKIAIEVNEYSSFKPLLLSLMAGEVDDTTLLNVLNTLLFHSLNDSRWDAVTIKHVVARLTPIVNGYESRLVIKACEIVQALVGRFSEIQLCNKLPTQSLIRKQQSARQYEECWSAFSCLRDSISGDTKGRVLFNLSPVQVREEDGDYLLAKHALLLYLNSI